MYIYQSSYHWLPKKEPDSKSGKTLFSTRFNKRSVPVLLILLLLFFTFAATNASVVSAVTSSNDFPLDYEEMFDNHGAIMMIVETETGRIIQANQAAVYFYGYPEKVIESMTIQDINQLTPDEVEAERKKAASEERNFFIFQHKLANGEMRTVEIYSWPYSPDQRELLFSIIKDITPRIAANELLEKQTLWLYISISLIILLLLTGLALLDKKRRTLSKALHENEFIRQELERVKEKYKAILDDIPALICEFLPDSTLTYVNRGYCEYFGFPQEALIGKRFLDLIPEGQHEVIQKEYLSLNRNRPMSFYDQYTLHGDKIKWQEWRDIAVFDQQDQINRYYSVGIDITERKELLNQLEKEKDRAEAATIAKSQFLGNMSHELRTPLNGFGGMLQLLELTDLTEEQQELTAIALASSRALNSLISNILDYSKFDTHQLELHQKAFDLQMVISNCIELFQPKAKLKKLDLKLYYDEAIGNDLVGDQLVLQEVLLHLLGNAIKFTDSGQVSLTVSKISATDEHSEKLRFAVEDTGIGITKDKFDSIFDLFCQGDDSTTKIYEGIGMGLSLAQRLVESMNGVLQAKSNYGEGSRFWFDIDYLPATLLPPAPS